MPTENKERQCLVTRTLMPVSGMVRFVIGPEGRIVPDVAGKLPGRGLWVTASATALAEAMKRQLFAKAAKQTVKVDTGLVEQTRSLLRRRALELLSLCRRSGLVSTGFEKVRAGLEKEDVAALLHASDASEDGKRKLDKLLPGLPVIGWFSREELAPVVGSDNPVHILLRKGGTSETFLAETRRLAGFENETSL